MNLKIESPKPGKQSNEKLTVTFEGEMFTVEQWTDNLGRVFESAVRAPGVRLIIETEKNSKKALIMTKEYRHEHAQGETAFDYRLPGGKVFDTLQEFKNFKETNFPISKAVESAARKEGLEEVGIVNGTFTPFEVSKAGASVEWDLHYYKVTNPVLGNQEMEEGEDIQVVVLTGEEIFENLVKGEIKEVRSAVVLCKWLAENKFIELKR